VNREPGDVDVAAEVRRLVSRFAPSGMSEGHLEAEEPLGARGLGLDSVAIVELVIECERRFGIRFPDELFDGTPLTIGRLVGHVERSRGPDRDASPAVP
jgi:acyl carrier protein